MLINEGGWLLEKVFGRGIGGDDMEQIFKDRFEVFNSREVGGTELWSLWDLGIFCGWISASFGGDLFL